MNTPKQTSVLRSILTVAATVVAVAGPTLSPAAEPQPGAATTIAPEVRQRLMDMAGFIAKTERFRVEMDVAYDAVQDSGQKVEVNERRTIAVDRSGRFRVDSHGSEGVEHHLVYDGKQISLGSMPANVYAQSAVAGTVDDAIKFFVGKLKMRLPLAPMLLSTFPAEFESRLVTAEYVETTTVFGPPAEHIVGTLGQVDFQVWIADGPQPLPQRIVLTYKEAAGQPQFRAQFTAWDLAPELDSKLFTFDPAKYAHPITFAAELNKIGAITPPNTAGAAP